MMRKTSLFAIVAIALCCAIVSGCSGWNGEEQALSTDAGPADAGPADTGGSTDSPGTDKASEGTSENTADAGSSENTPESGEASSEVTTPEGTTSEPVADAGNTADTTNTADAGNSDTTPEGGKTSTEGSTPEGNVSDSSNSDSAPASGPKQYQNRTNAPTWCKEVPKFEDYCPATAPTDQGDPSKVKLIPHIKDQFYADGKPKILNYIVSFPNNGCPVVQELLKDGIPKDCKGNYVNHFTIEVRHFDQKMIKYHFALSGNKKHLMLAEPCYENTLLDRTTAKNGGTYHSDQSTTATNLTYKACFGITLGVTKAHVPMIYHWNGRSLP